MKVYPRLSPKSIMGVADVKSLVKPGEDVLLFTVHGKVIGEVEGQALNKTWHAFSGQFLAVRPDGEKAFGSRLFLPGSAHDMVSALYQEAQTDDENHGPWRMPEVKLFIRAAKNNVGYEYFLDIDEKVLTLSDEEISKIAEQAATAGLELNETN